MHQVGPNEYLEIGTGDPIESENLVEFRLLYSGELLPSGGANSRAGEKHAIRRHFHPQLRRLWNIKPNLRQLADQAFLYSPELRENPAPVVRTEQERIEIGLTTIGTQWSRAGYNFVPLVTPGMSLRCSLDVLLLRPSDKQLVLRQGDLDGQLKTLFDALRIPETLAEAGGTGPQEDETPFFCLLQDDRLISEVRVVSDELLLLPQHKELKANDCFAVIHVKINHNPPRSFDNYFG